MRTFQTESLFWGYKVSTSRTESLFWSYKVRTSQTESLFWYYKVRTYLTESLFGCVWGAFGCLGAPQDQKSTNRASSCNLARETCQAIETRSVWVCLSVFGCAWGVFGCVWGAFGCLCVLVLIKCLGDVITRNSKKLKSL